MWPIAAPVTASEPLTSRDDDIVFSVPECICSEAVRWFPEGDRGQLVIRVNLEGLCASVLD